jgi:hypothetical protein
VQQQRSLPPPPHHPVPLSLSRPLPAPSPHPPSCQLTAVLPCMRCKPTPGDQLTCVQGLDPTSPSPPPSTTPPSNPSQIFPFPTHCSAAAYALQAEPWSPERLSACAASTCTDSRHTTSPLSTIDGAQAATLETECMREQGRRQAATDIWTCQHTKGPCCASKSWPKGGGVHAARAATNACTSKSTAYIHECAFNQVRGGRGLDGFQGIAHW